ncbi:gamma carbonic anhydrase family protein [Neisseria sp. N95_16]|uniref:Gamma carbonic anhydrase family protein n=1 Tax=Neisseria brasiliensis TaxID=2666100 RepID=A0A7X2GZH9_9NEIS|nr:MULTISPECIES: gamma carbonic anhydrase family protein [Neisseria]MRN38785.1 gamma carbonic anhydrase family protein [Neisseria brasiliensis]PJO10027.1 gamma carbonic anhydrase family protein [Neisseria sp. N95_16]
MPIRPYTHHTPDIHETCFIDDTAVVIGQVSMAEQVNVWPLVAMRGDVNHIRIGARTNIQDGSVLHVTGVRPQKPEGSPLIIGEDVTIGHKVILHGCTIGNRVLVGMGAIVLDDVVIDDEVMVGAGSVVPPGKHLQSGFLYLGSPVIQARALTDEEKAFLKQSAVNYINLAEEYK